MWVACSGADGRPAWGGRTQSRIRPPGGPSPACVPRLLVPLLWLQPYMGKGHGEGFLGPRGAGSVLCPFCDPCVWESEQERERASLLSA